MSKKDRIAVVMSVIYLIVAFFFAMALGEANGTVLPRLSLFVALLVPYWGYRFIKGDISFLKAKTEG